MRAYPPVPSLGNPSFDRQAELDIGRQHFIP